MLPSQIMHVFKGALPSHIITGSVSGIPNIANISRVWFIDREHVAIANQFFNKTAINLSENQLALIKMIDPNDLLHWELGVRLIRTETEGALFERISQDLRAVSWMAGLPIAVNLRSAMVFQVVSVRKCVEESHHLMPTPELYGDLLQILGQFFEWNCSSYWLPDETDSPLRLIASRGVQGAGINEAAFEPMKRLAALVAAEQSIIRLHHIRSQVRYLHTISEEAPSAQTELLAVNQQGLEPHGNFLGIPVFAFDMLIGIICCEGTGADAEAFDRWDDRYLMLLSRKIGEAIASIATIPEQARGQLFRQVVERTQLEWVKATEAFHNVLSARERQVSVYVAKGHTNAEIAKALFISTRTVTTHLERIFQKLQVTSRAALTRYVVEKGLLTDDYNETPH